MEGVGTLWETGKKTIVTLHDVNKSHEIVDALWLSLDIRYAPRKVPLDQIFHDLENFQNRKKEYSEHSVDNIVKAVLDGKFDLRIFNPLVLWKDEKDKKLYILSWHSRYEAFKRLSTQYKDHKQVKKFFEQHQYDFTHIPALVMDDVSFEDAKFIALTSNALATIETDTERAEIYRSFRKLGKNKKFIEEFGRKCEKSNRSRVDAYSYLNPDGMMIQLLDMFANNTDENAIIKRIAVRIGNIRKKHPELSNTHEEELYTRLFNKGWYGNQIGQIHTQQKFIDVVEKHISRVDLFNDEYLNINNIKTLSFAMQQYYEIEKELKQKKQALYTEFHTIRRRFNQAQVKKREWIGELEQAVKDIIGMPIEAVGKLEQIESFLFDVKPFIDDKNIMLIKNRIMDEINAIEQAYYMHKKRKPVFMEAGKKESALEFGK